MRAIQKLHAGLRFRGQNNQHDGGCAVLRGLGKAAPRKIFPFVRVSDAHRDRPDHGEMGFSCHSLIRPDWGGDALLTMERVLRYLCGAAT